MKENSGFFVNRACEYFPCHDVKNKDEFNCLFCYCPLYTLGDMCGGGFRYTEDGIKDCSNCKVPHSPNAKEYIADRFDQLAQLASKTHKKIGEGND